MALWLLKHGADPNQTCNLDLTPMSFAMTDAPLPMIDKLFEKGASVDCGQLLHHAVMREKDDTLQLVTRLVEAGAPINAVKYEFHSASYEKRKAFGLGTPLHRAAEFGKKDIVDYLLLKGADPLKPDSRGRTPRFWAEHKEHREVVEILRKAEESCIK
jgi:ankyrin repeat protein